MEWEPRDAWDFEQGAFGGAGHDVSEKGMDLVQHHGGDDKADDVGPPERSNSRTSSTTCEPDSHGTAAEVSDSSDSEDDFFASPSETAIVLDFDDTLFPSTWLLDDLQVPMDGPLDWLRVAQGMEQKREGWSDAELAALWSSQLAACERGAVILLRLCAQLSSGGVFVVTLARRGWVDFACERFMPKLWKMLRKLNIPILYAKEYLPAPAKQSTPSEGYRRDAKRAAIASALGTFYNTCSGQTWKNIVSIGDREYEREATKIAVERYFCEEVPGAQPGLSGKCDSATLTPTAHTMSEAGFFGPKLVKVRCKTVQLLSKPSVEEMIAQFGLLYYWMRPLVEREMGVDIRLTVSDSDHEIAHLHRKLTGRRPGSHISWKVLCGGVEW